MGKEVKIGLAVIGVLLCVFGGVLFFRLRREAPGTSKVAATKTDDKRGSEKPKPKEPAKTDKSDKGRSARLAGKKTTWSTSSEADSETQRREVEHDGAPALDASPYRNRPALGRRGRYDDDSPAKNVVGEAHAEEAGDSAQEQEADHSELTMPDDRFAQQPGDVAFLQDDGSGQADASDGAEDAAEAADDDRYADNRHATDRYADGRNTQDRYGRDLAIDRTQHGEEVTDGDAGESSEAAESEDGTMRLSPLVDDQTEVRPAANDRHSQQRYEQKESEGGRFDRRRFDGGKVNEDRFARDGLAANEEEMADEAEPAASEPADEHPLPLRSETDSYVVEPNDNFWRISQKVYGTGAYFKALEEHNRRQYGDKTLINVGDVLSVPPLAALRKNYPQLCPKPRNAPAGRETALTSASVRGARGTHTYTVAEGDTLFDIARHELGKASRWAEIYRLNREQLGEDFNYLSPGMQLVLPDPDEQADPVATHPRRDGYRR